MSDDNALMMKVQQGQLSCLGDLYERHKVSLFNYFLRLGNSHAASEDMVQETFSRALVYRSSFRGEANFRSWIYGIGRNVMADFYRKRKSMDTHLNIDDQEPAAPGTLSEDVYRTQQQDIFAEALASLPTESREILVLSRYQQFNYEEIANMMNCNLNTLKSRMRKALQMLEASFQRLSGEHVE